MNRGDTGDKNCVTVCALVPADAVVDDRSATVSTTFGPSEPNICCVSNQSVISKVDWGVRVSEYYRPVSRCGSV